MGRLHLLKKILLNDRLGEYKKILEKAKDRGYKMVSLSDYIHKSADNCDKKMIIRHDIDHVSLATRKMLDIEKSVGATASYYFRDCTLDAELMKKIYIYMGLKPLFILKLLLTI